MENQTTSIIARAKALILNPGAEWPKIAADDTPTRDVFMNYILPMAAIGPVCGFIGSQVFGYGAFGVSYKPTMATAAIGGFVALVLAIVSFFVLTLIADILSPRFGGELSNERSFKLVAYATTPAWLVGIFTLVPALGVLGILAFYSVYLIYTGATPMLKIPKEKAMTFTIALIACGFALNLVVAALTTANMSMLAGMGLIEGNAASVTITVPEN